MKYPQSQMTVKVCSVECAHDKVRLRNVLQYFYLYAQLRLRVGSGRLLMQLSRQLVK